MAVSDSNATQPTFLGHHKQTALPTVQFTQPIPMTWNLITFGIFLILTVQQQQVPQPTKRSKQFKRLLTQIPLSVNFTATRQALF